MKIDKNEVSGLYEVVLTEREDLIVHADPDDLSEEEYIGYDDLVDEYLELQDVVKDKNKNNQAKEESLAVVEEEVKEPVINKVVSKVTSPATKQAKEVLNKGKEEVKGQVRGDFSKLMASMERLEKEKKTAEPVVNDSKVDESNHNHKEQKEPLTNEPDRELEYLKKALSLGKNSTRFSLNSKTRMLNLKPCREVNQGYKAYDLRLEKFGMNRDFDMVNINFKESSFELNGDEANYGWLRIGPDCYYPTSFSLLDIATGELYEAITLTDSRFDSQFEDGESSYDRLGMYFINGLGIFQVLIPAYGVYLRYFEGSLKSGKREDYNYNILIGKKYPKCKALATLAFKDLKAEQVEF